MPGRPPWSTPCWCSRAWLRDGRPRPLARSRNAQVAAKYKGHFPNIKLFTIDRNFGGWARAQATHFNDGGLFVGDGDSHELEGARHDAIEELYDEVALDALRIFDLIYVLTPNSVATKTMSVLAAIRKCHSVPPCWLW